MPRSLPPLNPLHAFEVAARLGGFTAAAAELGVSQVAVSRQVRVLERYLGVSLFQRSNRAVALTPAGRELRGGIAPAFDAIAEAARRVSLRGQADVLSIQSYTTFSQRWLIPRLPLFHRDHPEVEIHLTASTTPVDFRHSLLDAAIQSGLVQGPGLEHDRLATIELLPVCSPAFLHGVVLRRPEALLACTLLHSTARPDDWRAWLHASRCHVPVLLPGIRFETSALAYEAALQGLGVAIGIKVLVERNLRDGMLVAPFPTAHVLEDAYYLVRPRHRPPSRGLRQFRSWLQTQLREETLVQAAGGAAEV